jgi:hypothetical protein
VQSLHPMDNESHSSMAPCIDENAQPVNNLGMKNKQWYGKLFSALLLHIDIRFCEDAVPYFRRTVSTVSPKP